jgi:hypothetical protein
VIKVEGLFTLVLFALWVYTLIEVFSTPESAMRGLPKAAWVIIVLLLPLIGVVAWWVAGRPEPRRPLSAYERSQPAYPEYNRPGRAAAGHPERDEEFLKQVRARAEEQRKAYEQKKKQQQEQDDQDSGSA